MSRIRAAALGAALLVGFAGIAGAQGAGAQGQGRGPGMGHRGGFERGFAKDLNLTDAQKARIKTIHEKYHAQFQSLLPAGARKGGMRPGSRDSARVLRQKGDSSRHGGRGMNLSPEVRQKLQTLRQQEQAEIRTGLTADQRTKFDAAQAQRKQWMEQHHKNRGAKATRTG